MADEIVELPVGRCRECATRFRKKRHDQIFCHPNCKKAWWRRAEDRGKQAYPMLMEWRRTRGTKKGVLSDLAHLVDGWVADDKERDTSSGRPV